MTGNTAVNVIQFPPVALPNTNKVLLFDAAAETSSFLAMSYNLEPLDPNDQTSDLVYRTSVQVLANRNEINEAMGDSNSGGEPFSGNLTFVQPFLHPGASLPASDPGHQTEVLTFETATNNTFAVDWTAPSGSRVRVFSSASQLSTPTDLNPDPSVPSGTFVPNLLFAVNDVLSNRVVWNQGPGDLLSLSYDTGQWVVVLHRAAIAQQTGSSLVTLKYIEAIDNDNLRVVEFESSTIVGIRLFYQSIPVSFPR